LAEAKARELSETLTLVEESIRERLLGSRSRIFGQMGAAA
jgi:hypothetical protein